MTQRASPTQWIENFARFGYAAKGLVYTLIGILAVRAAFHAGGKSTDSGGVLNTIAGQPFGKFLLVLIGLGFVAYTLWRLIEAVQNPERQDSGAKNISNRLGSLTSAIIYGGLAFTAFQLVMGVGGGDDGSQSSQVWIARVMALPLGRWLVGLGGAVVLGSGFYEIYKGFKAKFRKHLKWQEMSAPERTWGMRVGRAGLIARGIVFSMVGFLVLQSAYQVNPSRAQDPGGALQTLQQWTNPWVFAIIAFGLAAYGIHMLFMARYGRIAANRVHAPDLRNPVGRL
ncbi:MAG TPA: DUF1206 domain-containing protein [Leptolyngbyaceae cyanobacterium]